jgi:hypothetical protein
MAGFEVITEVLKAIVKIQGKMHLFAEMPKTMGILTTGNSIRQGSIRPLARVAGRIDAAR